MKMEQGEAIYESYEELQQACENDISRLVVIAREFANRNGIKHKTSEDDELRELIIEAYNAGMRSARSWHLWFAHSKKKV